MSEVASLELQVSSDGVKTGHDRLLDITMSSAAAEKATHKLAKESAIMDARWRTQSAQLGLVVDALHRQKSATDESTRATDKADHSIRKWAIGVASALSARAALSKVIGETKDFDNLIARMGTVADSAEEARMMFDDLERTSDDMMATENDLAEAFLHLTQSGLDGSTRSLRAMSDLAAGTGSTIKDLAEVTLSASMGMTRSLKQFGIQADVEGSKMKLTFRGVTTTINNSAKEIQQYLVSIGEVNFAGSTARQLDTMGGGIKKLEDAWGDLFREVGRSSVGDLIKDAMVGAADAVNLLTGFLTSPTMNSAVETYRNFLTDVSTTIMSVPKYLSGDVEGLKEIARARALLRQDAAQARWDADNEREWQQEVAPTKVDLGSKSSASDRPKEDKEALNRAKALRKEADKFFQSVRFGGRDDSEDSAVLAGIGSVAALKESLLTQEEALADSYNKRRAIIEQFALDETAEDMASKDMMLGRILDQYATEMGELEKAKKDKREALFDEFRTEDEAREAQHQKRLQGIQEAADEELIIESEKNALLAKEEKRYQDEMATAQAQRIEMSMQGAAGLFAGLAATAKNVGAEQSDTYKTLFALSKSFAAAQAAVGMYTAMSSGMSKGWPEGIPLVLSAATQGAGILASITSTNYAGAYDRGGYIPAGKFGVAGEYGPEIVNGPARVMSRENTRKMLEDVRSSSGGGEQTVFNPRIVVTTQDARAYLGSDEGQAWFFDMVKKNRTVIRDMGG